MRPIIAILITLAIPFSEEFCKTAQVPFSQCVTAGNVRTRHGSMVAPAMAPTSRDSATININFGYLAETEGLDKPIYHFGAVATDSPLTLQSDASREPRERDMPTDSRKIFPVSNSGRERAQTELARLAGAA